MKSGNNKKHIEVNFNLSEYRNHHRDLDCDGNFDFKLVVNASYDGTALGPIKLPAIPMVACTKCDAAFYAPRFEEWIDGVIAERLITSKGILSKNQLKFLRQYFGLTQEELALKIKTDKFEISRMESLKSSSVMSAEKQTILKLYYARLFGIKDAEKLYDISEQAENEIKIDPSWFPADEIKQRFSA